MMRMFAKERKLSWQNMAKILHSSTVTCDNFRYLKYNFTLNQGQSLIYVMNNIYDRLFILF
jgi:hypothetical protein